MKPQNPHLGKHWLIELFGCEQESIEKVPYVETSMYEAAQKSGATIMDVKFHQFSPYGVSGVIIISESHFTIHTWPENGYAAVDIFTCGDGIDVETAILALKDSFKARHHEVSYLDRGNVEKSRKWSDNIMTDKL